MMSLKTFYHKTHVSPFLFSFSKFIFRSGEARKHFKTCVNILSTIKNENNEKYLILRKRYYNECPPDQPDDDLNLLVDAHVLQSPGSRSGISEYDLAAIATDRSSMTSEHSVGVSSPVSTPGSPYRDPPPYKPPPKVMQHAYMNQQKYGECVDEYKSALRSMGRAAAVDEDDIDAVSVVSEPPPPELPPKPKASKDDANARKQEEIEMEEKENIPAELSSVTDKLNEAERTRTLEKQISVKEATKKFNRIASEEEASKVTSPPTKKKPEKVSFIKDHSVFRCKKREAENFDVIEKLIDEVCFFCAASNFSFRQCF